MKTTTSKSQLWRISALAKCFGLSRSTLLHYDQIGLLKPSQRNEKGYRYYNQHDYQRLKSIKLYREAGLSLDDIAQLLEQQVPGQESPLSVRLLEQRLAQINTEIQQFRTQQRLIIELLGGHSQLRQQTLLDKQSWVKLLRDSGMDEDAMWQWHANFESAMPQQHQDFLASLGIASEEIQQIRQHARSLNNTRL